jgi:hypothetical protein
MTWKLNCPWYRYTRKSITELRTSLADACRFRGFWLGSVLGLNRYFSFQSLDITLESNIMAVDFSFNKTLSAKTTAAAAEQQKSQFWLNIGYVAEGAGKDGEDVFVSLPMGIPMDTMEKLKTNSSNPEFAQLQAARNDLWEQLMKHAQETLKPGEDLVFSIQGQIRRVKEDKPVSVGADNKFAAKIQFA